MYVVCCNVLRLAEGQLFNYICRKQQFFESEAACFMYQLLDAVQYLHCCYIAHLDIKVRRLPFVLLYSCICMYILSCTRYFNPFSALTLLHDCKNILACYKSCTRNCQRFFGRHMQGPAEPGVISRKICCLNNNWNL